MTDKPFSFWNDEWLTFQRSYMDALSAFTPQQSQPGREERPEAAHAIPGQAANAWTQALDQWWKTMAPDTHAPVRQFYDRLIDQGRGYFEMTEELNKVFRASSEAGQSALRWREAMEKALSGMKQAFTDGHGRPDARKATAAWELPLENWQRMVSSMSVLPGDALRGVNIPGAGAMGLGSMNDLQQRLDQFLTTPAVGHLRERQEKSQDLARLVLDYSQAVQDYGRALSRIGLDCIERAQVRLAERGEEDEPLTSMRAVYDFWVDSCEEAYAEHVIGDEYIAIHGRLVNSLMALKRHGQMLVDETLSALDMPTRGEVDTLHQRFQQLRREGHAMRAELNALREQSAAARTNERGSSTSPNTPPNKGAADSSGSKKAAPARRRASSAKKSPKKSTRKSAPARRTAASRASTAKASPKTSTRKKAAPKKKRARRAAGRS